MIKKLLLLIAGLFVLLIAGAGLSVWLAHDTGYEHTRKSAELPQCNKITSEKIAICQVTVGTYSFRARIAGMSGSRGNLILLHGYPETSIMWQPLIVEAAAAGYRVVAFDQRGYSPGARPEGVDQYGVGFLVEDVLAIADAFAMDRFHLVGHDWGSGVGWGLTIAHPDRVQTWTSLSIPHIASFGAAIAEDKEQQDKSSYMALFRTPWLPEALFSFNDFAMLRSGIYAEHSELTRQEYLGVFREPGAMTAALNWYRAANSAPQTTDPSILVPYLFIWGNSDPAVGRTGVERQVEFIKGPFRQIELDAGHWLMESHAAEITNEILAHLAEFPMQ